MLEEWYLSQGGSIRGPFSESELQNLVHIGRLTRKDKIRKGKSGVWGEADISASHLFARENNSSTTSSNQLSQANRSSTGIDPPNTPSESKSPNQQQPTQRSQYPALELVSAVFRLLAF